MSSNTLLREESKPQESKPLEALREVIEHAAHLLPGQGPITAFVHHNTLHAFEHLPFEQAVLEGGRTFGCHPYLPENRYREKLARNRIRQEDIEAVLIDDLGDRGDELLGFLGTRFHLRLGMLAHPLRTGPTAELRWVVAETDALRRFRKETPKAVRERLIEIARRWVMRDFRNGSAPAGQDKRIRELVKLVFERFDKSHIEHWTEKTWESFSLHLLWLICRDGVEKVAHCEKHSQQEPRDAEQTQADPSSRNATRIRDVLLDMTGEDSDLLSHEILIRFCAAFLDQGFGSWGLNRESGFYQTFISQYGSPLGPPDRWLRGLQRELKRLESESISPIESIAESLKMLGVTEADTEEFITQSLLALHGYAGMIWQVETRGDRVASPAPKDSLIEFLAIRLILDRLALAHVAKKTLGYQGPLNTLRERISEESAKRPQASNEKNANIEHRAFLVFQLAQLLGWDVETLYRLSDCEWLMLVQEIEDFSGIERRRIYHLAFERQYRLQTLDAVALHCKHLLDESKASGGSSLPKKEVAAKVADNLRANDTRRPSFQIVCCIDDREESFRRHLEEVAPDCETLGAAGFFSIAMYYRGAADAHFTPLCPVVIKPDHYVTEHVVYSLEQHEKRRRKQRRAIGTATRRVHMGSRTFAGGWLAAIFGSLATIPLVTRILFPRATAKLRELAGGFVRPPAVTQLQLERTEETPGKENGHVGYSLDEMAVIVEMLLRDIGTIENLARLFVVCGHGSSSMNNPHEAAHDCGACAGGRGGPNARAFAQMANNPIVREKIAANGLTIPSDTFFVGAYHNTCNDSVTYFDLDRLPPTHTTEFEKVRDQIDEARKRSAHERCRRFETAELNLDFDAALKHVEARSEDLSQVRPEYGHATNSLCFVGRREWSRGLFLDRRAFLQSYEPDQDDENFSILTRVLQAVIPVCAGINLEYYFSYVDPTGYGCGTKLPHNIAALLGVMNGVASDLRPGLPWQMVEIHEPVRLLFVIETTPEAILAIMEKNEGIDKLIRGAWVQLATLDGKTGDLQLFHKGKFTPYTLESNELPKRPSSVAWYRGWRDHLGYATILPNTHATEKPASLETVTK